jgi:RNA polymerase sigma-70 factor, ECF subfamily
MPVTTTIVADEKIIALLRQRDSDGISMVYDKYAAALYGVIVRIVHSRELAEEVSQDVFMKIWRNFESYDGSKGRLFTWMVNIARNAAIDATRAKGFGRQNQEIENVVNIIDTQQSTSLNPETLDVQQLTQKLTSEHQILIDMIYFKGYTQQEVADALEIPLGTVKTRARAAINRLRELF